MDITELLALVLKTRHPTASFAGLPPMIRVHGDMRRINLPAMDHKSAWLGV